MMSTTTIENYCIDCKAVAQPDCEKRKHIVGTLGEDSNIKQSQLFPRYSFAVVTGRYKIYDHRSNGPIKIIQIATADREEEARLIVSALNQNDNSLPLNPDPEAKIEQMVHELAYERVKHSYLFNQLGNEVVDRKDDELAAEIAALIETWIVDAVNAECKEG